MFFENGKTYNELYAYYIRNKYKFNYYLIINSMTENSEKSSVDTSQDEKIDLIPLILFEKYLEITYSGIEYLKSFKDKVHKT